MVTLGTEEEEVDPIVRLERAALRVRLSVASLQDVLEAKQNYNPGQPRRPRGTPIGGQWAPRQWSDFGSPSAESRAIDRVAAAQIDAFVLKHRKEIIRVLGAAQALGGGVEMVGSIPVAIGGAGASETGVGLLGMALANWMANNGYDNVRTGFQALLTGEPQQTDLYKTLRLLGLKDQQANAVELLLLGGTAFGGVRVGKGAVEKAINAELLRRTARAFEPTLALDVRSAGRSLWFNPNIRARGDVWEAFDAARTGYVRTPNSRVFDQISPDGRVAISNKTLDLYRETYLRTDKSALYRTLKRYIDDAARYTPKDPRSGKSLWLSERRIHLLLRSGDSIAGQALQLAIAESYAKQQGVLLVVEYAH